MNLRSPLLRYALIPLALLSATTHAATTTEGTLTGQIGVQVTIEQGCSVGNGTSTGTANEWGSINFGTYADLSNIVDGSVLGSDGANTLTITCTSGLTPTLKLDGGLNETSKSVRAMISGSATIPYHLYSDAAYSKEIAVDGSISPTADNSAQKILIYGQIRPSEQASSLTAGTYTDTVTATLSW